MNSREASRKSRQSRNTIFRNIKLKCNGNENVKKTMDVQHTLFSFLCRCFARLQRKTSSLHILWRKCSTLYVFLFAFFLHFRSFLSWWPLEFLIFSPPLLNFLVFLPTKFVSIFVCFCLFIIIIISRPCSFSVFHVSVDIKIQSIDNCQFKFPWSYITDMLLSFSMSQYWGFSLSRNQN